VIKNVLKGVSVTLSLSKINRIKIRFYINLVTSSSLDLSNTNCAYIPLTFFSL
jgi:hypothetical protein